LTALGAPRRVLDVDERFQELMQQLGEAVNDAVMQSKDVDAALDKVRDSGIDVFLVLEATICVRRKDGEPVDVKPALPTEDEDIDLNDEDLTFLKRLRISVE
jgi:ArsR family metal-binding transcriptional regulator